MVLPAGAWNEVVSLRAPSPSVTSMLLMGRSTEQIAETLHVSPKTVANTRYQIRGKLGVHSDIELVRLALRQGLLEGEESG